MLKLRALFEKMIIVNSDNVLTVYIDTDPTVVGRNRSAAMIWLKDSLKNTRKDISSGLQKEFDALQKKVLEEAKHHISTGKSLIMFASADFFEISQPKVNVKNEIWWGKPSLGQAEWILEEYRNYGIVKVDSEKLHYYIIGLNEVIDEWEEKIGEDTLAWQVKHLKPEAFLREKAIPGLRGGDQKEIVERHISEEVQKFWKSSSSAIENIKKSFGVKEIIIAGLDTQADLYQKCISINGIKIIGKITTTKELNINDFLTSAQNIIKEHEKELEKKLIDEINNKSGGNAAASLGLKPALRIIQEGRASTIAIKHNLDTILLECRDCTYVLPNDSVECIKCSSKNLRIGSMKSLLPPLLRKYKTQLNIISHHIPEEIIRHDGIGVLWRY